MRIDPELDEIVNGKRGMLRAIEVCLSEQCLVSAITLIFATIDALAALTRPLDHARTTRTVFLDWVDRYLKPQKQLKCNALDLYSARCAVLHTYSTESDLTRQGKANAIVYEWRSGPPADASAPLPEGALTLVVEDLHQAFQKAVHKFIIASEMEPQVRAIVRHHLRTLLCYRPWPQLIAHAAA